MKNKVKLVICSAFMTFAINTQAQRNLNIENSPNFRTLAGIENKEGQKIKEGMIYRSGNFSKLTDNDVKIFNSLHINTIVDFRNDFEIEKDPDFIPVGQSIVTKRAVIGSIENKSMNQFMAVLANPKTTTKDIDSLMIEANKGFVTSIHDFVPFFDAVKDKKEVVLFHCSAGKDRTGLASSLLLHILDVPKEEIMADYLRSNEAVAKTDLKKYSSYGIPEEKMATLMGVKAPYLEAAWEGIEKKYGSIDAMLLQEFGIDSNTKQMIKSKYLIN